ncbi:MAG TPA: signal peptidase I [Candidatus Limnocylindrales bacterium]|nr:signal peptidase I [Candidatus Limnocylindrales bacterium]
MRLTHGLAAFRWAFDLALIASVVAVLAALVVARGLPSWGHPTLAIIGGSMEPTIPKGAVVVLDPVSTSDLRPGDVVTVRIPTTSGHVTHRVLDIGEADGAAWIRTKGDANPSPDPALLPADQVVGRVGTWIPALGYLVRLLSVPQGVLFMLAFALSLHASARLIEELELELHRSRRSPAGVGAGATRPHAPEPSLQAAAAPPVIEPVAPDALAPAADAHAELAMLVAAPVSAPAWGPRSSAGWSPRTSNPAAMPTPPAIRSAATAPPDPDPVEELPRLPDPAVTLSPTARRAFRQRSARRRATRAGGVA